MPNKSKPVGEWRTLTLDNYDEIVDSLNTLEVKKEDVLTIDRDEKTGKITVVYFW